MIHSRLFVSLAALGLSAAASTHAVAGDPCPIEIALNDLGSPADLDRDALLANLAPKKLWLGLTYHDFKSGPKLTVHNQSPAEKAGLRSDDRVVEIDLNPVATSKEIDAALDATKPGSIIWVSVVRQGTGGDEALEIFIQADLRDPLMAALDRYLSADECLAPKTRPLTAEVHTKARERVYVDGKLRCKDAHRELAKDSLIYHDGVLVMYRTATEVLLAMPGVGTTCVQAETLDGDKLTPKAVAGLFKKVAGKYVTQRKNNP